MAIIELIQVQARRRWTFRGAYPIYGRYRDAERSRPLPQVPAAETVPPGGAGGDRGTGLFDPVQVFRYRWDQTYTAEQYARLPVAPTPTPWRWTATAREGLIHDLWLIDARFGGRIVRRWWSR